MSNSPSDIKGKHPDKLIVDEVDSLPDENVFNLEGYLLLPYKTDLPVDPNHENIYAQTNGFYVLCRKEDHSVCATELDNIFVSMFPEVFEQVWEEGYCFGYYSPKKKEFIFNSPENKQLQKLDKVIKDKEKQKQNKKDLNKSKEENKEPKTELEELIEKLEKEISKELNQDQDQDGQQDNSESEGGEGGEGDASEESDPNEGTPGNDDWTKNGGKGQESNNKGKKPKKDNQEQQSNNGPSDNTKGGMQQCSSVPQSASGEYEQHEDPTADQMKLTPEELAEIEAEMKALMAKEEELSKEAGGNEGTSEEGECEELALTYDPVTCSGSLVKWSF